jgi:hypothetical protein
MLNNAAEVVDQNGKAQLRCIVEVQYLVKLQLVKKLTGQSASI